jgi:hypothetical protein
MSYPTSSSSRLRSARTREPSIACPKGDGVTDGTAQIADRSPCVGRHPGANSARRSRTGRRCRGRRDHHRSHRSKSAATPGSRRSRRDGRPAGRHRRRPCRSPATRFPAATAGGVVPKSLSSVAWTPSHPQRMSHALVPRPGRGCGRGAAAPGRAVAGRSVVGGTRRGRHRHPGTGRRGRPQGRCARGHRPGRRWGPVRSPGGTRPPLARQRRRRGRRRWSPGRGRCARVASGALRVDGMGAHRHDAVAQDA